MSMTPGHELTLNSTFASVSHTHTAVHDVYEYMRVSTYVRHAKESLGVWTSAAVSRCFPLGSLGCQ